MRTDLPSAARTVIQIIIQVPTHIPLPEPAARCGISRFCRMSRMSCKLSNWVNRKRSIREDLPHPHTAATPQYGSNQAKKKPEASTAQGTARVSQRRCPARGREHRRSAEDARGTVRTQESGLGHAHPRSGHKAEVWAGRQRDCQAATVRPVPWCMIDNSHHITSHFH